jgi:hypothetical protein
LSEEESHSTKIPFSKQQGADIFFKSHFKDTIFNLIFFQIVEILFAASTGDLQALER